MNKHIFRFVLLLGIIAIVIASLYRYGIFDQDSNISVDVSSLFKEAIDISELSTAEFKYRGIAEVYTDDKQTQIKCRICYSAVVKAGIDMSKIELDVDTENKNVTVTLPEITLNAMIDNEKSMTLLPSNADVEIANQLIICREDAEREATASTELMNTAKENLQATVEGLLYPIIKSQGYSLTWRDDAK